MEFSVSHARVFVGDYARARAFYVDTLGLHPDGDDGAYWMLFRTDGAALLIETNDDPRTVGRVSGVSLAVKDIVATYETLVGRGVRFTGPPEAQFWGGIRTDFYDADGNLISLVQMPDGDQ